jgi:hypothetical protein
MLTPAEELGLHGVRLAGLTRSAFLGASEGDLLQLMDRLREEAKLRQMFYLRDGQLETIRLLALPLTALPEQLSYIRYVCLTILHALKRLPDLYLADADVRRIVPMTEPEEGWLRDCWGPSHGESNPVFGRLDAVVDLTSPMWKNSLHFIEPNLSGVGGLHIVPTCEQVISDLVLPFIHSHDPRLQLKLGQDMRELLIQEVLDHLEAIGRRGRTFCFVEPKYASSGPDEQEALARYYQERHHLTVVHADPSELVLKGDEVYYNGTLIDVAYRDYEVRDLIELGNQAVDIRPIRTLFQQNRIVSTIAGDFDHKSCWEILTDPDLVHRHFTGEERQVFRRHILWTRVLSDRKTLLPSGQVGQLLEYVRSEQETLVLKPNRSYGGDRVLIGPAVSPAEWDAMIGRAVADESTWVVQQVGRIPVYEFPVVGADGHIHVEPFYTVMGFAPTRYGLSSIVRASQKQVVNVAQRGGMCTLVIGYPPSGVVGPELDSPSATNRA